jgi:hypothetical protein
LDLVWWWNIRSSRQIQSNGEIKWYIGEELDRVITLESIHICIYGKFLSFLFGYTYFYLWQIRMNICSFFGLKVFCNGKITLYKNKKIKV